MHDAVPRDPSLTTTQTVQSPERIHLLIKTVQIGLFYAVMDDVMDVPPFCAARPKKLKLLSGLLGCRPFRLALRCIIDVVFWIS